VGLLQNIEKDYIGGYEMVLLNIQKDCIEEKSFEEEVNDSIEREHNKMWSDNNKNRTKK
jgi:hypothetical protein